MRNYRPAPTPAKTTSNRNNDKSNDEPKKTFDYAAYAAKRKEMLAEQHKRDSINKVKAHKEYVDWAFGTSDFARLKKLVDSLVNEQEYALADSIGLVHYGPLSSERSGWMNRLRERINARIMSEYYLGRLDSAWANTQYLMRQADDPSVGYADAGIRRGAVTWQCVIMLEAGMPDSVLERVDNHLKTKVPTKDLYANYVQHLYSLKARALLMMGKKQDAKAVVDDYLATHLVRDPAYHYQQLENEYMNETMDMIYQQMGKKDSALKYYRLAVYHSAPGYEGYHKWLNITSADLVVSGPVRRAFYELAFMEGYDVNDPANKGTIMLEVAVRMGVVEAYAALTAPPEPVKKSVVPKKSAVTKKR